MDPRHPELAISRLRELMKQYDKVEKGMKGATTSAELAQLEREGSLVVQEICLVAPRIHEAMMQTSRQRRHDLTHGVLDEPQDTAVELGARTKYEQPFEPVEKSEMEFHPGQDGGTVTLEYKMPDGISNEESGTVEKPVEKLTFEQQHTKYTLELDKELETNGKAKKLAKKKTTKKAKK